MTKAKLQKEREQHLGAGNQEEVERLDVRLAELEARAEDLDRMRTSTISSIALINDRNRKNNILKAEQERARVEGHIDDPFTRRKSQPVLSVAKSKDTFDDEEMTSEKLLQLENQKKKAKELQVQAMKDREEAELTRKKKDKQ